MTACRCGSANLVEIDLAPAGRPVRFSTCRDCEHRWWSDVAGTGALRLDDVLSLVAAA
ncbi:MAG: hypothetical protein M3N52_10580 [Actinomycetota bacterium]|nr:hypothetical protein [Actinomycetota bacterium]